MGWDSGAGACVATTPISSIGVPPASPTRKGTHRCGSSWIPSCRRENSHSHSESPAPHLGKPSRGQPPNVGTCNNRGKPPATSYDVLRPARIEISSGVSVKLAIGWATSSYDRQGMEDWQGNYNGRQTMEESNRLPELELTAA